MTTGNKASFSSGILLIVLFSCTACYLADFSWIKQLRFSPLIVGIIVGMLFANTLRRQVPAEWNPGISFCSKQILRTVIGLNSFNLIPAEGLKVIEQIDTFLLTMAMTALGVETGFDKFMKAGPKPFLLALILFVRLVFGGYWLVKGSCALLN